MRPAAGGALVAEFISTSSEDQAHGLDEAEASYSADWVAKFQVDPLTNRVSPLIVDVRVHGTEDVALPPHGEPPYRLVLNGMQQRDRTNVARHVAQTGTGQEIAILLYTNPDAKDLGMLQRIQPPYHELNSDLRLVWEYRVTAGGWVPPHLHNTEEIWYVTAGEGTYVADGEERVIRAGDAIILYPGSWHGLLADRGDIEYLVIDVGIGKANPPH
jgi:mannose-6-phosphate isomerase-like protein (cupin superfamily)